MDARRARSALVVGSRSSWSFRNWTLSKATVLTGSDSVGAAAVERPPTATDMSVRTAAIPNAATCVRPRATKPSRLQRRRQCGASAAITQAVLTSLSVNGLSPCDLFRRFAPLRSAAASGLPGCPDHRSISKSVPVRGSGRQRRPPRQCHPRRDLRPAKPWNLHDTNAVVVLPHGALGRRRSSRLRQRLRDQRDAPRAKRVERDLGRVETIRWGPRVIDIDICSMCRPWLTRDWSCRTGNSPSRFRSRDRARSRDRGRACASRGAGDGRRGRAQVVVRVSATSFSPLRAGPRSAPRSRAPPPRLSLSAVWRRGLRRSHEPGPRRGRISGRRARSPRRHRA